MAERAVPGVLGHFVHIDGACDAIRELKSSGFSDLTVYTAHPNHEIEEAIGDPISPVRWFTLIGCLIGCAAGFGMTIWMSRDWPLLVGGKAIAAIPAYVAIGFEMMVLVGALSTIAGIWILAGRKPLKGRPYHPSFSDDRIGIFVPCEDGRAAVAQETLEKNGSVEVSRDA